MSTNRCSSAEAVGIAILLTSDENSNSRQGFSAPSVSLVLLMAEAYNNDKSRHSVQNTIAARCRHQIRYLGTENPTLSRIYRQTAANTNRLHTL